MITGCVDDPLFDRHWTGSGHPERPERLAAVRRGLEGLEWVAVTPRDATRAEVEAAHTATYLDSARTRIAAGEGHLDADTAVCEESWAAAIRAAGSALALGEAWLDGTIEAGFACLRPPGHHAERERAMGFCLIDNIAVLAYFLRARGKRVAIVDWDVHHGNGTQDIFWDEPEVGYLSLHQWPLYPGTGAVTETGAGNIKNICLPAGSGDSDYARAFETDVLPWLEQRAPDVILVSAGFDAHRSDPLASMSVSSAAFGRWTEVLLSNGAALLSLLEGGYDLRALEESVRAHVSALVNSPTRHA